MLQNIDMLWLEHLEAMDYVRSSVRLRAFGQRDPLIEYKNEGLRLFHELEEMIDSNLLKLIPHMGGGVFVEEKKKLEEVHKSGALIGGNNNDRGNSAKTVVNKDEKVGRNDPCPCGSGKKYKKCCGI